MKVAIIGCGNMGLTYAKSFLSYNKVVARDLTLVAKNKEGIKRLKLLGFTNVVDKFNEDVLCSDVIILSVKPQDLSTISKNLYGKIKENTLVISILAGIKLERLSSELNHNVIVRAMPNMPSQFGMGITCFIPHKNVNIHQLSTVENLLSTTGRVVLLDNEDLLDGITALSGSGPAYFYYFINAMIEAGIKMGLDEGLAALLVKDTMMGSYHVFNSSNLELAQLISKVASKGGTTEAALSVFNSNNLNDIIKTAILSAAQRSLELSKV
ncbi:MAG: pyrroline-5-carboxylate reductase [bacterium]